MNTKVPATLNMIGCGKAGRTLGHLWHRAGIFNIGGVLTRSIESATAAVEQMGAGTPLRLLSELESAELTLIATPDQEIKGIATSLASGAVLDRDSIVFHLSGALDSSLFRQAGLEQVNVASVHPLRSFADPNLSAAEFVGTWCGFEGESETEHSLYSAFEKIGARMFRIEPDRKLIYHAASVMVSNYINALIESGINTFQLAGIDRQTVSAMIAPIVRNTCDNIIKSDPGSALTGPIMRGDWQIVERELENLRELDPNLGDVYRVLGKATLSLAESNSLLTAEQISKLGKVLY